MKYQRIQFTECVLHYGAAMAIVDGGIVFATDQETYQPEGGGEPTTVDVREEIQGHIDWSYTRGEPPQGPATLKTPLGDLTVILGH